MITLEELEPTEWIYNEEHTIQKNLTGEVVCEMIQKTLTVKIHQFLEPDETILFRGDTYIQASRDMYNEFGSEIAITSVINLRWVPQT